jgi:hypothetical protein
MLRMTVFFSHDKISRAGEKGAVHLSTFSLRFYAEFFDHREKITGHSGWACL